MSSDVITLHLKISAADYVNATRLFKAGALNANPLTMALLEMSADAIITCTARDVRLRRVFTGRRYSGPLPSGLADYLVGFRSGRRVLEDHEFELVLESESK